MVADGGRDYDYAVIGSGFGGSVAALRLAQKGYRVVVLEQGRRWNADTLPKSTWNLRRFLWLPALGLKGFFSLQFFKHVVVLHGNAVGGGSITYANTLLVPPDEVWSQGNWSGLLDGPKTMQKHYETARKMLGVTKNRLPAPADDRLKKMAEMAGCENSYYLTDVAVHFGPEGTEPGSLHPDPYFDGKGPARRSCTGCGACMIGCRIGAKNTLDLNYLYLAEDLGAEVRPETQVTDIRPDGASQDGREGYRITCRKSGRGGFAGEIRCKGVVLAAASLGTQNLLLRLKEKGALPRISSALGKSVRTNAESLIGVRFPGSEEDLSTGIAIGSGFYLDRFTHIEATRYPRGSDALSFLTTIMAPGRSGRTRPLDWFAAVVKLFVQNPLRAFRLLAPKNWAKESMILLVMQTIDGELSMRLGRRWYWPFSKTLKTEGGKIPATIPDAQNIAIKAAEQQGGVPMTTFPEIFLNIPMTAHCMGGACIARTEKDGVVDHRQRVFGYENFLICDGSVISANLGVNPSLTITALAEHAMSHIPEAAPAANTADGTASGQDEAQIPVLA